MLTNTHVTSLSPLIGMELGELPSLHVADVSVQPSGVDSETEYVPGASWPVVQWSPSAKLAVGVFPFGRVSVNVKLVGSPSGSVSF